MLTRIDVITHPVLGPAVSGRSLYKLIAISKSLRDGFSDWFRQRQRQLNLVDKKDFIETTTPIEGKNRNGIEFILTLETARKYCSLATSGRGLGVLGFLEAYELNPAIAEVAETPQQNTSLFESAPVKPELVSKFRPEAETSADPLPVETPTVVLTPAQQQLRLAQEQLQQAQKAAEEETKRMNEVSKPNETLSLLESRLGLMEGKVNTILYFFQQASHALRGLAPVGLPTENEPVTEEVAEPTTRMLLVRLVNSYAAAERRSEHETWKYLYGQFDLRMGFNAYAVAPNKPRDQSYLTVIEERGQIDKLYELARKLLVLPELR